jgi:hypothetical protein
MKGLVSWLVGVLDHHIPWFTGLIRTSFRWITATAWPWVKELTAPAQSYLRDKRSPARMMRVYNNPWRFLVLLAVVLFICGATMKGSHFMWASLLQAEPKFLSETPKFRHLIKETYLPQIVLGVILLCVWMLGTWLSKSQGMRSVPTLFLSKVDKVIAAFGTWRFEPEFRALMRHRCGRKGGSDMDLLVRTVLDDTERRRNLFYSLERSRIPIAKSYLLMRLNEAMFWNLLLWLVFFFPAYRP